MIDINVDLFQQFKKFLVKKSSGGAIKKEIMQNEELAKELQKQFIRKFETRKVHASFIDNILGTDLANMQFISKFNKGLDFYYVSLVFIANIHGLFF